MSRFFYFAGLVHAYGFLIMNKGVPVQAVLPYLSQPRNGYRYSTDAVVLAGFATDKFAQSWADIGTGCGVMAYCLAHAWRNTAGLAIERDSLAYSHARKNLKNLKVTLVKGDLRCFSWKPKSFDLIICNPPFFDSHAFRPNKNRHIRVARHTDYGDIVSFGRTIKPALNKQGRFCLIFPNELVAQKKSALEALGFYLWRQLEVKSFVNREVHRVCLEFGLEPNTVSTQTLVLYKEPGFYTNQAWQFIAGPNMRFGRT